MGTSRSFPRVLATMSLALALSAWFGVALIPVGSLRTYQVVVQVTDWPEGKAA